MPVDKFGRMSDARTRDTGLSLTYINPFPNKPWFLRVCSVSLLKTL